MKIKCPDCGKENDFAMHVVIPKDQSLTLAMECKNEMFSAKVIAGQIDNMRKLLEAVAKDAGGKVMVFIQDVKVEPHKIAIRFFITSI